MVFKKMYKCKLTVNKNFYKHTIIDLFKSEQNKENIGFVMMYYFLVCSSSFGADNLL